MARSAQMAAAGAGMSSQQARGPANGMERTGSGSTGTRDEIYGVVSVLYHALQGAETYEQYVADAQKAGDGDLERFFQSCRSEEQRRAQRAKGLLLERLGEMEDDDDGYDSREADDEDEE